MPKEIPVTCGPSSHIFASFLRIGGLAFVPHISNLVQESGARNIAQRRSASLGDGYAPFLERYAAELLPHGCRLTSTMKSGAAHGGAGGALAGCDQVGVSKISTSH